MLTLDFETYYSKEYSLSKLQTDAYILDPRFEIIGVSIKRDADSPPEWFSGSLEETRRWCADRIDSTSEVCAHHAHFDGFILTQVLGITPKKWIDTLSMGRAVYPWLKSHSLSAMADSLGIGRKGHEVTAAIGKRRADFTPAELAAYGAYCMNDVALTAVLADQMLPSVPKVEQAVIDMTIRMFTEPKLALDSDKLLAYYEQERVRKESLLASAAVDKSVLMSNPKLAELLLEHGVSPPRKISATTGKSTYAFSKTDKEFTELLDHPDPAVQVIVGARLGVKSTIAETRALTVYETSQRGEGKLPVYLHYWGAKCVPGETEVLTRSGWVSLIDWDDTQEIAQVTPTQSIIFDKATKFIGSVSTTWIDVSAPYLRCAFTEGHTMPYLAHGSMVWKTAQAVDMVGKRSWFSPLAGNLLDTGKLGAAELRVLAMVQADGSFSVAQRRTPRLRVSLKKPRKIERARRLLLAANIRFSEQEYASQPGYVSFVVSAKDLPPWLTKARKVFGAWLLDSTPEGREAFVNELQYWDGWTSTGSKYYCSTVRSNAEWVVTLLHLTGRCGRISEKPDSRGRAVLYRVGLRERGYGLVRKEHVAINRYEAIPYCATTKTGFFLARHKERIFITGNTTGRFSGGNKNNMQNLPARGEKSELREAIIAPPGHKIVVGDSSNIELRVAMAAAGQNDVVQKITAGIDLYCDFASKLFGRPITKDDKPERMLGKIAMLSLQYGAGAEKFREMVRAQAKRTLTIEEAQDIVNLYRAVHSKIVSLWHYCGNDVLRYIHNREVLRSVDVNGWCLTTHDGFAIPGYPGVVYYGLAKDSDGQWSYQSGAGKRVKIYGGKCVDGDTLVFTDRGWMPLRSITTERIHDGEKFVSHGGKVYSGVKQCVEVDGVLMTPDHKVLTNEGWKPALEKPEPYRPDLRGVSGYSTESFRWQEDALDVPVPMREENRKSWCRSDERSETGRHTELWVYDGEADKRRQHAPWHEQAPRIRGLAKHAGSLPSSFSLRMEKLWRTRDTGVRAMARGVREFLGRYGQYVSTGLRLRPSRQQWPVFAVELSVDYAETELPEQAEQSWGRPSHAVGTNRNPEVDVVLSASAGATSREVYDLINCGDLNRFVVLGATGPFIVHNCVENFSQHVARQIVIWQTACVNEKYPVALSVHDEIVCVVPESEAEACAGYMRQVLQTAPKWCRGQVPLAGEVGIGDSYGEAK